MVVTWWVVFFFAQCIKLMSCTLDLPFGLCQHELTCKQEQFQIAINRLENNQDNPRISKCCPTVVKNDLRYTQSLSRAVKMSQGAKIYSSLLYVCL